jgi:adenylate cyclase
VTEDPQRRRLTLEQLAAATPVAQSEVETLVSHELIKPDADGMFTTFDVQRVRAVVAMCSTGITLEQLLPAYRQNYFSLEPLDLIFPTPALATDQTWADVADSIGIEFEAMSRLVIAAGFVAPHRNDLVREDDSQLARDVVRVGSLIGGDETRLRVARILGDATRRSAEAGVMLFQEGDEQDPHSHRMSMRDPATRDEINVRGAEVMRLSEDVLARLYRRHLEHAVLHMWSAAAEMWLDQLGIRPSIDSAPGIAFVDLTGYTQLTETTGDRAAARLAAELGDLAETIVTEHRGRVVKLLGDGAMLHFDEPLDAVRGALRLVDAIDAAELPRAHSGVHSGPVITRDGDYFGRTVNVAARISSLAGPGEVWTSADLARHQAADLRFEPLGAQQLKGVGEVEVARARWAA